LGVKARATSPKKWPRTGPEAGAEATTQGSIVGTATMGSSRANTLELKPNGLYIVLSTARSDYPAPITEDTIEESFAKGDQFEWGLYWCVSAGVGESRRYRERRGIWRLQTTCYPDVHRADLPSVEDDERIIVAVHIADMDKAMIDRLNEDLTPKLFHHSLRARAQAARPPPHQRQSSLTGVDIEPDDGRSRKWLGQALNMMNQQGYISLREDAHSIASIEREAVETARRNLASGQRSVESSAHVEIQRPSACFRIRLLDQFLDEEDLVLALCSGRDKDGGQEGIK